MAGKDNPSPPARPDPAHGRRGITGMPHRPRLPRSAARALGLCVAMLPLLPGARALAQAGSGFGVPRGQSAPVITGGTSPAPRPAAPPTPVVVPAAAYYFSADPARTDGRGVSTPVLGRLAWRAQGLDRVEVAWRGAVAWAIPVEGGPPSGVSWQLLGAPLPSSASAQCDAIIVGGRGRAWVRQQPSARNDHTARVVIEAHGAGPVAVELRWR